MLTEADVREALQVCFDRRTPSETPLNIVDLGLLEAILLTPDHDAPGAGIAGVEARYTLTLTLLPPSEDEDANAILRAQVDNRLRGLMGLSRVTVLFADSPGWGPERITPEGRRLLHLDSAAAAPFPILNNRLR